MKPRTLILAIVGLACSAFAADQRIIRLITVQGIPDEQHAQKM